MSQAPFADADLLRLAQLASELAQAQTLEGGVSSFVALIEGTFACAAQLVWNRGEAAAGIGPADNEVLVPSAEERRWLADGELVLRGAGDAPSVCMAPLRARGELLGWIALQSPRWTAEAPALLQALASQAGPALALLEASQRHEDRVAQLHTLSEIGRALSGVLDLDALLEAIYQATRRVLQFTEFYIALYEVESDTLDLSFVVLDGTRHRARYQWHASKGLAGHVLRRRAPLRTNDYMEECARQGIEPIRPGDFPVTLAWMGIPMIANDRIVGLICVSNRHEMHAYRDEHLNLLATIGAQAAVAIENARLYQRTERQARQLAILNQIGRSITSSLDPEKVPSLIIEQVCDLLNVEEGSLLLADEESGELVFAYTTGPVGSTLLGQRLPRGVGFAGYVMSAGESVIVNDVQRDARFYRGTDRSTGYTTRTLLAVPLRAVGGVQGVIEVLNRRDGEQFTEEDCTLLEAVADQAVIALENARRFAQVDQALARRAQELARSNDLLQHNLRSLTALNALGLAINSALRSAYEIFGMTASGVVELSGALGARVLMQDGDELVSAVEIGRSLPDIPVESVARNVLLTGRPETTLVDAGPARAVLTVPLRATQRNLGALCVYYANDLPGAPDQETIVLFATQAAVAVESLDLFTAVRDARDQMASILSSIREGIVLIDPDGLLALANEALRRICMLPATALESASLETFLRTWEQTAEYAPEEWTQLRRALDMVTRGQELFASGELNTTRAGVPSVQWAALTARGSGGSDVGVLLVLRDISEAKEAERLRQDLTNMIIHDLRSPLSSVMASIELLMRGISGELNASQRHVLNIASTSSVQMLDMVNTLLDISRLEDGHMPLDLGEVRVTPLVERAADRLVSLARERNVRIESDLAPDLPLVRADPELVVRVLQNLLANAIKFSSRGARVRFHAFAQRKADVDSQPMLCIAVSDQGVGIARKDQEKIFAKFGQVGERRGGSGLGLTFCKLAVEAHGGDIWVESTPGTGSTFFFTLPIVEPR